MSESMNESIEAGAGCGVDGRGPGLSTADVSIDRVRTTRAVHELTIVSDVICPWCFVAKMNLEKALELAGIGSAIRVTWRPFELNPNMPQEGMNRREYRARKFGSWERSRLLDSQVSAAGKLAGITFRHDLAERTPNTHNAHRLIWLAGEEGVQSAVVDALFNAYFVEGRDVGDGGVLAEIGRRGGISEAGIAAFQAGVGHLEVAELLADVASNGLVSGVPAFVLDGTVLFSGALNPQQMAARLRTAGVADVKR